MAKRYGSTDTKAEPYPFELVAARENDQGEMVPEIHQFTAYARADAGDLMRLVAGGVNAGNAIGRMLTGYMANNDGLVKAQWTVEPLTRSPYDTNQHDEDKFRGPDGELYPMDEVSRFEDPALWTSRRRYNALLDSEDTYVNINDLVELAKDLMAVAAGRPTTAQPRS
jgi:hypothetical protein